MAFEKSSSYVEVNERIVEFRTKYPDGSLQPWDFDKPYEVVDIGGVTHIVVVAAAYRSPDDTRPGVGMAQESWPGKTPYTKGSELMNAETSAWGRAIVAALAADTKRGIASAQEVRNRQAEADIPPSAEELLQSQIMRHCQSEKIPRETALAKFVELGGVGKISECSDLALLQRLFDALRSES
tara:strand:- start:3842 stop:4390 length:549 start_codon:yes stop_codon:yes gene_type:complete